MSPEGRAEGASSGDATVDPQHPWLGLASFTEATRRYFFGRDEEIGELARRVQRKLLTILFGQSGLGKTSILQAGIVPRLRPDAYCPVYVRIDYSPEAPEPSEQIKQAIMRETEAQGQWTQAGIASSGETLWEFLHHRDDVLRDANGRPLIPLLIFDQFEEIFTLAQGDAFGRQRAARFLADLADLVENRAPAAVERLIDDDDTIAARFDFARADYRILIALREDYLAHLESLKSAMPSITQNRMRLARMTGAQALTAVINPGGALVSQEVAESIVRFVAGGAELPNAEVEPSLLSLICRELNNARLVQGRDEISADLLAGSRETILSEFYERALADQPAGVRAAIEDNLLTESGYRENLAEERVLKAFAAAGAAPGTLATLVDRRLLRIEERLDVRRVELTHDVLSGVVKASRDLRLARIAGEAAEAQLATQRERERATRQALVRARKIATVCAVLAIGAVGASIFGYFNMKRAQQAEVRALDTRQQAEAARAESEKLVGYLLDDFYDELEPVGRLDIGSGLAQRAIAYYNGLPPALRTPATERNRALALVRYGSALRTLGKLQDGKVATDEAVKTLSDLRAAGDTSDANTIGLARGLEVQSRLASSASQDTSGLAAATQAVDLLKPIATAPGASAAIRRQYGRLLIQRGFQQLVSVQNDAALATLGTARDVLKNIANLQMTDIAAAVGYAEACSWLVQGYANAGRVDEALAAARDGLPVTAMVLAARPGHLQALRAQALITSPVANMLGDEMRSVEGLVYADQAARTWSQYVSLDPGNTISWSNLAVSTSIKAVLEMDLGRPDAVVATAQQFLALEQRAPPSVNLYQNLALGAGALAELETKRGHRAQAASALLAHRRITEWLLAHTDPATALHAYTELTADSWSAIVAGIAGDHRRAIDQGLVSIAAFERITTTEATPRRVIDTRLRAVHAAVAQSAFELRDFPLAAQHMRADLALWQRHPAQRLGDKRDKASDQIFAALTYARAGDADAARALIVPALAFERELATRKETSPQQRLDLATALYVAAVAGVGDARPQLAEARALVDKLPPAMLQLSDVAAWRTRIAAEAASRRAA